MTRLLVAALEAELTAFPEALPGFERLVTGPGKLQAVHALTRALENARYEEIVVVGTAGAIDPELESGVHEVAAATQHDATDIDDIVGEPVSVPGRVHPAPGGRAGETTIATGDRFIDDAASVGRIRESGAGLVDMETYAYVWVAQQYGVPIRVLKAVSDRAQDDAVSHWRAAVTECSALLRARIESDYGV